MQRDLPRIRLLVGPATLPSQGKDRMDFLKYRHSGRPRMTGQELLAAVPEIAQVACVEVDEGNPYETATLEDVRKLAARVNELLQFPEVDGVVFVHGTNTLEETAYFLTLTVRSVKPIVVTGAQRPFTALSTDAPLNLLDACRVAAQPEARGKGAVVVANGEINSARDVTKTNTYHVHTFRSRDVGLLGYADADKIVFYRAPIRRHTVDSEFSLGSVERLPRVDILYIYAGAQRGMAEAACGLGAKGLVVAGVGAGSSGDLAKECADIAAAGRAVVVRSSRVGEGRVVRESNYHEPGMVAADNLSPQKAALLLSLALTRTSEPDDIQRMFEQY
ncbi:MAG: asparaginase [Betaproteobacteria bacterium]|nr:asparaginase [Betaproteobacteria bacterium]